MNGTIKTMLMVILFIIGCKKDSNPISTASTDPAFVVDNMKISSIVKTDTTTGSPSTFISVGMVFHFSGRPGSLDGISVSTGDIVIDEIFEPVAPTSIDLQRSESYEFKFRNIFLGQDSIFIRYGFGGRFWERKDTTIIDYGTFSIKDSVWIQLQR
jgi:hypothetical protein